MLLYCLHNRYICKHSSVHYVGNIRCRSVTECWIVCSDYNKKLLNNKKNIVISVEYFNAKIVQCSVNT